MDFCGKLFFTRVKECFGFMTGSFWWTGGIVVVRDAHTVRHFFGGECFFLGVPISWIADSAARRLEPERVGLMETQKKNTLENLGIDTLNKIKKSN